MSCLTVSIERKGGISASCDRIGGIEVGVQRKGGIEVNMGLVCGANLGVYEILWASDAPLLTIDEGYLITKK